MQVLLFIFSLIFFAIVTYGYFNLMLGFGVFVAFLGSVVIALFAWFLARVIGQSEGGYKTHWPLLIPLFFVSAAGVYNSLMLSLEGDQIIADAARDSQDQFAALRTAADRAATEGGVTARRNQVQDASEALFSEIRNPTNCGQGPEAERRIAELQRLLPGFTRLSNSGRNCERNEEIISDYRERINQLLARANWNNPALDAVRSQADASRQALDEVRTEVATSYNPLALPRILANMQEQDTVYRDLRQRLALITDVRELSDGLHISEVQSLGNAGKLPSLLIERLDEAVTWVFLIVALGFDLLLVHCFRMAAANRVKREEVDRTWAGAW
jgi:hypothetical protein